MRAWKRPISRTGEGGGTLRQQRVMCTARVECVAPACGAAERHVGALWGKRALMPRDGRMSPDNIHARKNPRYAPVMARHTIEFHGYGQRRVVLRWG